MTRPRDLVVIGASAGGVHALVTVLAEMPRSLPAAFCVVLHIPSSVPSALAQILDRAGALSSRTAVDGAPLRHGEVLVAPPGRHLVVGDGRVALSDGPRVNGHRPSVDVLFRSASEARGERVIGVILTGARGDGSAGLASVSHHGGASIVQDPLDALYADMPADAIAHEEPEAVLPLGAVGPLIRKLVAAGG